MATFPAAIAFYVPSHDLPRRHLHDPRVTRGHDQNDARLSGRGDRLLRVILDMGNFGANRKNDRRKKYGAGFFGRKLGSLLGALNHSVEMLTLFPIHSLRSLLRTLPASTAKSLRQLFLAPEN